MVRVRAPILRSQASRDPSPQKLDVCQAEVTLETSAPRRTRAFFRVPWPAGPRKLDVSRPDASTRICGSCFALPGIEGDFSPRDRNVQLLRRGRVRFDPPASFRRNFAESAGNRLESASRSLRRHCLHRLSKYHSAVEAFLITWSYPIVVLTAGLIVLGGRALLPTVDRWQKRLEQDIARSISTHGERP